MPCTHAVLETPPPLSGHRGRFASNVMHAVLETPLPLSGHRGRFASNTAVTAAAVK